MTLAWTSLLALTGCADFSMDRGSPSSTTGSGSGTTPAPVEIPETTPPDPEPECVADAPVTLYVSPDDSNSMSSPVLARLAVLRPAWGPLGWAPIRPWEFLNYYTFAYPPAAPGDLDIALDLVSDGAGNYTLQVGVSSPPPTREPLNLSLVIDDSGSMDGAPLATAATVGRVIAGQLQAGDVISVVTWSHTQEVPLAPRTVAGPNDAQLLAVLDDLTPGGSTDLSAGLAVGYDLLEEHFAPDRINRLIFVSDAGANVGETDANVIGAAAGGEDEAGIYLVGVGVGTKASYFDAVLDLVTDLGKGASLFVPDEAEAEKMLGEERFLSTVGVAARDVQIRLDLPPGFSIVRTSAEEVGTRPEDVRPQHIAPGDAMVVHQTMASACGEAPPEAEVGVTVTWLDPITFEPHDKTLTTTVGALAAQDHALLTKGAAILAYVDALRSARDLGTATTDVSPTDAIAAVDAALALLPGDADLAEVRSVLLAL